LKDELKNKSQLIAELKATRADLAKLKEDVNNISVMEDRRSSFREVIYNNSPLGIILIGFNNKILTANSYFCKMVGYSESELNRIDISKLIHFSDSAGRSLFSISDSKSDDSDTFREIRFLTKKGIDIWGYVSIKCIKSSEGKVVHYFAMIQDVTEKKKIERAGDDLRIRYHNLFENSPISLWERDDSQLCQYFDALKKEKNIIDYGQYFDENPVEIVKCINMIKILNVNKATLKLFEVESKEEFYDRIDETIIEKSIPALKKILNAVAMNKESLCIEFVSKTLKGNEITLIINLSRIPRAVSREGKFLLSLVDITDRKQIEKEKEVVIDKMTKALKEVKELRGMIPICSNCKRIRSDEGFWGQLEEYVRNNLNADFSHGLCPTCAKELYGEYYEEE